MDEKQRQVDEFISETIRTLSPSETTQVFGEEMLHSPISVLEPRVPIVVEPQTTVLEAVTLMQTERVGCVLVARANKLKGIFTERDVLIQVIGRSVDAAKITVRKLMTANPEYLRPSDSIAYALNKMSVGGFRHVPLVDKRLVPVGVISVRDIVNYIVRFFPKSVLNLPTLPRQNYVQEREGA